MRASARFSEDVLPATKNVSRDVARAFHRRSVGLVEPAASIEAVLDHLGYVQIDPINVSGRMQEHILRNRVRGYKEGDLMKALHGPAAVPLPAQERSAFEHHLPDSNVLVAFPLSAWPYLLGAMHRRGKHPGAWAGRLTPTERSLADRILAEIAQRGPLSSEDIADERRSRKSVWGSFSLAKTTLQKLFFHGRVLIAQRVNNRRLYDLPERVLPPAVLSQPEPAADETARWLTELKLRQRRLTTLKRTELRLVEDMVQPVKVEGCPALYSLRRDEPLWKAAEATVQRNAGSPPLLLAPLDPLIYDRRVTQTLWEFDYTWEVYTPPKKRKRGYYALPVLGSRGLVGHMDVKADRANGRIVVVSAEIDGGLDTDGALARLAAFLGLACHDGGSKPA